MRGGGGGGGQLPLLDNISQKTVCMAVCHAILWRSTIFLPADAHIKAGFVPNKELVSLVVVSWSLYLVSLKHVMNKIM